MTDVDRVREAFREIRSAWCYDREEGLSEQRFLEAWDKTVEALTLLDGKMLVKREDIDKLMYNCRFYVQLARNSCNLKHQPCNIISCPHLTTTKEVEG